MEMSVKERIAILVLVLLVAAGLFATHLWSCAAYFFQHGTAFGLAQVPRIFLQHFFF
jgi:hypothetical protein